MSYLRDQTDQMLKEIAKKVNKEYAQALREVQGKLNDHFRKFAAKDTLQRQRMMRGEISLAEYQRWRAGQMATGKRWETLRNQLAMDLVNHRKIANNIINGYKPEVYALAYNYGTYEIESAAQVDTYFTLYRAETVERIMRENPDLLPTSSALLEREIAEGRAVRWESGQLQSMTMQSILQGDGVREMAKRIATTVCVRNRSAALRYARTAINGAENAGKQDSYYRAQDLGLVFQRQWYATMDDRTRPAHRELDGQTVGVDEPFVNSIGEIMFPGDTEADGDNYWNCRCTMGVVFKGFERDISNLNIRNTAHLNQKTYEEWKKAKPVYGVISPRRDI